MTPQGFRCFSVFEKEGCFSLIVARVAWASNSPLTVVDLTVSKSALNFFLTFGVVEKYSGFFSRVLLWDSWGDKLVYRALGIRVVILPCPTILSFCWKLGDSILVANRVLYLMSPCFCLNRLSVRLILLECFSRWGVYSTSMPSICRTSLFFGNFLLTCITPGPSSRSLLTLCIAPSTL